MKKIFTLFSFLLTILFTLNPCYSSEYWAKTYGESYSYDDHSIQQTADGGYILLDPFSWVSKLDSSGNVIWQKTYSGGSGDYAESVQQTTDGGYIVAGNTSSYGAGYSDLWVLKLDSSGNISWQKTYGGASDDYAESIQQTTDGGFIVAGYTYSFGAGDYDLWVLKLDSSGNVIWQKTYGGGSGDYAESIQQTTDGGYIIIGRIYGEGGPPAFVALLILKLDANGNVAWQKTYLESGSSYNYAYSIQQTTDGGFIVAGLTITSHWGGDGNIWLLKIDFYGNISWQKTYGGGSNDYAKSIQQTTGGGFIVAGYTYSFGAGDSDLWVLNLDSSGNVIWQKTYGGGSNDYAHSIQQTTDGGFIVAGYTLSFGASGLLLMKLDSNGDIPTCSITGTSNATVTDTSAVPDNATCVVQTSSATITDTTVIPQDISVQINTVCYFDTFADTDMDGILNFEDNCYFTPNGPDKGTCTSGANTGDNCTDNATCGPGGFCSINQENIDGDTMGDACDPCLNDPENDFDNDTHCGDIDNCPSTPNGPNNGTCVMTSGNIVYASNSALLEPCTDSIACTCQMEQGDINGNGIGDACECYADCDNSTSVNVFDLIILKNEYNRTDCPLTPCNADINDDGNVNIFDLIIMKNQYNRSGCPVVQ